MSGAEAIEDDEFPVKHPPTDELPIEDHGIIGNMYSKYIYI